MVRVLHLRSRTVRAYRPMQRVRTVAREIVMTGGYEAIGLEAEFEPGSRGRVLRNRPGITSLRALQRRESEALLTATQRVIDEVAVDHRFTAADVCRMHHGSQPIARSNDRRSKSNVLNESSDP